MYRILGSARLKDGGRLEIGVVEAPDAEHEKNRLKLQRLCGSIV